MAVKNCYPLPLISELINNLWGVQYFTKLDVQWSYNNMNMQEGDEWKAAFWTNRGLFKPLVIFFRLTNSPATFQTMMNNVFQNLIVEGVVCVYLDNILIYTKTLEEYYWITHLVLECLHQHQLYLKPEKCEFEQTWIEHLGLIILHRAVEIDPVKVAGMAEWPEPKNKKKDFSHHAHPLFDLIEKDALWSWGPPEQIAFDTLKHAVTSGPVLLFLNDNSPFWVEANSSNFATGAMLSQQSPENGKWHLVAFYSKSLNTVEQNLAIIQAFEEWRHFLKGTWHKFEFSPFFLDMGWHLHMGFEPQAQPSENKAVNEFVDWMKRLQEEAQAVLAKEKDDMAQYYDCRRTLECKYQPGDQVYLNASNITTTGPQKSCHTSSWGLSQWKDRHCFQPLPSSHLTPLNPAHTFAPTLDNSNASPANPNGNSNSLSVAINTPPETFPHRSWPCHTFLTPYPSLPDPSWSITTSLEQPAPPTDPIRIPLWPTLGSYPTPVDSAQLCQLPPPYPLLSRVLSSQQQRVKAYTQQCNEVLRFLCLSPVEFARRTRTLLTNLGYPDASATLEVWADRLLDFHERYLRGNLPENMQGTLGIDDNLQNELRTLVEEIHTSLNPHPFEDPLDPARSFHVQCEEPVQTQNKAPSSIPVSRKNSTWPPAS
ncbi:hypothetical protein E4T56_gene913 [Termitomyces sp. T112]|nr:hypothetical protein E4T56_gene913 [Termitomyces sp. T112]